MPKFNRSKKFTLPNVKKVSDHKAVIYKIKSASGKNLYTGIAGRGNVQERLTAHKTVKKEIIPGGKLFQIAQVKTKVIAKKQEDIIIKRDQPKFNKQGK